MRKAIVLFICFCALFLNGCGNYYSEATSKALSVAAWASKDSIANKRFELASEYVDQTCTLIKAPAPKDRIPIPPIYRPDIDKGGKKSSPNSKPGRPVIILPAGLDPADVVVVGSADYQLLLEDQKTKNLLEIDNKNLKKSKEAVEAELAKQIAVNNKMILEIAQLKEEVANKRATIFKLYTFIIGSILAAAGYVAVKVRGFFSII